MNISKKAKIIAINVVAALLLLTIIGYIALNRLNHYTLHDEIITVPSFYGMTPSEALQQAKQYHIRINIVDSLYKADSEPGSVIDQYPIASSQVKRNRIIQLMVNTMEIDKISLPRLTNTAFRQTINKLTTAGFKIGKIHYIPSEYQNLVLGFLHGSDTINAGDKLAKGSTIDIILGSGNTDGVTIVPNVQGKSVSSAIDLMLTHHINTITLDVQGKIINTDEHLNDYVFRQFPTADTLIPSGSTVYMYSTPDQSTLLKLIAEQDSSEISEAIIIPEFTEETDPGLSEVETVDSTIDINTLVNEQNIFINEEENY